VSEQKPLTIISSSSIDNYAEYANTSDRIVFVSRRTGEPQIWLKNTNGTEQQLTSFERCGLNDFAVCTERFLLSLKRVSKVVRDDCDPALFMTERFTSGFVIYGLIQIWHMPIIGRYKKG